MAACSGRIVASTSLVNQVGSFSTITLFTPSVDSNFRISLYLEAASIGSGKMVQVDYRWTDDNGSKNSGSVTTLSAGTNQRFSFMDFIHATAGNSITLVPGANFNDTADAWSVFVVLEEL
jgi:hypothetical protein